ncbi:MAG: DUF1653 domain-containing protein [Chlamydiota bacterium]
MENLLEYTMPRKPLPPPSVHSRLILEGGIYEHYKGSLYQVLFVGLHSESLEEVVTYRALYGERAVWTRPLDLFLGSVEREGKNVLRFRQIMRKKATEHLALYLAGNIQKGHENESNVFWTEEDRKTLEKGLAPCSVAFLNPAFRADDLTDPTSVFGRDMTQVFCADVVLVDARERRGLGVGAEMMWAKIHSIPVLTIAPANSHYHKQEVTLLGARLENWRHPFVASLSDAVVDTLQEGIDWLQDFLLDRPSVRGAESIYEAMSYYQKMQLPKDHPMCEIFAKYPCLQEKILNTQRLGVV